jgi:hypothetical protein
LRLFGVDAEKSPGLDHDRRGMFLALPTCWPLSVE